MALTITIDTIEQRYMIADTHGKGTVIFLVRAEDRGAWWRLQRADKFAGSRPEPCNMTSQLALSEIIVSFANHADVLPSKVEFFDTRLSAFVPQNQHDELVFHLVPEEQHTCFRVPLKIK